MQIRAYSILEFAVKGTVAILIAMALIALTLAIAVWALNRHKDSILNWVADFFACGYHAVTQSFKKLEDVKCATKDSLDHKHPTQAPAAANQAQPQLFMQPGLNTTALLDGQQDPDRNATHDTIHEPTVEMTPADSSKHSKLPNGRKETRGTSKKDTKHRSHDNVEAGMRPEKDHHHGGGRKHFNIQKGYYESYEYKDRKRRG